MTNYFDEVFYEVWYRDSLDPIGYNDDCSYTTEEQATVMIEKYKTDIANNPIWDWGDDFEFYIKVVDNPNFDFDRVMDDDRVDYFSS